MCVCVCIGIVLDQRRWTGVEWDYKIDYNKYVKDVRTFIQVANEYLKVNNKTHTLFMLTMFKCKIPRLKYIWTTPN